MSGDYRQFHAFSKNLQGVAKAMPGMAQGLLLQKAQVSQGQAISLCESRGLENSGRYKEGYQTGKGDEKLNNSILQAVAAKLEALWPGRKVFVDETAAGADGSFFVELKTPRQTCGLDRQRRQDVTVVVVYYTAKRDNMEYYAWADTMFAAFETLEIEGIPVLTKRAQGEKVLRDFHFIFELTLYRVAPKQTEEVMGKLEMERRET